MTKCPYVPPTSGTGFSTLMLRARHQIQEGHIKTAIVSHQHRCSRQIWPAYGGGQGGQRSNKFGRRARLLEAVLGVHADAKLPSTTATPCAAAFGHQSAALPETSGRTRVKSPVCHLLHEPQRTRPGEDFVAVYEHTASRCDSRKGTLLRHAQAGIGRSGSGGSGKGTQYPHAGEAGGRRLDLTAMIPPVC